MDVGLDIFYLRPVEVRFYCCCHLLIMASLIKGYISVLVGRVLSGYPVVIAKRAVVSASSFPVIPTCAGIHSMWIVIPWF